MGLLGYIPFTLTKLVASQSAVSSGRTKIT